LCHDKVVSIVKQLKNRMIKLLESSNKIVKLRL